MRLPAERALRASVGRQQCEVPPALPEPAPEPDTSESAESLVIDSAPPCVPPLRKIGVQCPLKSVPTLKIGAPSPRSAMTPKIGAHSPRSAVTPRIGARSPRSMTPLKLGAHSPRSGMTPFCTPRTLGSFDRRDSLTVASPRREAAACCTRLLEHIFAHYAGWAGADARMGLARFRRFLRDFGLLETSEREGLSIVQADLLYTRATGTSTEKQALPAMDMEVFSVAVVEVALHFYPASMEEATRRLLEGVLEPIAERLLDDGQDVARAAEIWADPGVAALFQRSEAGLGTVFVHYAQGVGNPDPFRRGHWTVRQLSRFTADYALMAELSHTTMTRLFSHCAQYQAALDRGLEGKLSYAGFQLLLLVVAQRVLVERHFSPLQRLAHLLLRMSAVRRHDEIDLSQTVRAAREAYRSCKPSRPYQCARRDRFDSDCTSERGEREREGRGSIALLS